MDAVVERSLEENEIEAPMSDHEDGEISDDDDETPIEISVRQEDCKFLRDLLPTYFIIYSAGLSPVFGRWEISRRCHQGICWKSKRTKKVSWSGSRSEALQSLFQSRTQVQVRGW